MNKPGRRHHYVSQFYLRGFTDTGNEDGLLWVHSHDKAEPRRDIPANVCFRTDYQRIDIPGIPPDIFDKTLGGTVEANASKVLNSIIRRQALPATSGGLLKLMRFVALLSVQNPSVREGFGGGDSRMAEMRLRLVAENAPARFASEVDDLVADGFIVPDDLTVEKALAEDFGDNGIGVMQRRHMRNLLSLLESFPLEMLMRRTWQLLVARREPEDFICTEHPVVLVPHKPQRSLLDEPGFGTAEQVVVPLCSRLAMVGSFEPSARPLANVTTETVAHVNSLLINHAHRFLFTAKPQFAWRMPDGSIGGAADLRECSAKIRRGREVGQS